METMIDGATSGAARAIASERLLARDLVEHEQKASSWRTRALEAVSRGDDGLARQAISRAHEHEAMAQALVQQQASTEQLAQALRSQVAAMRAKQAEARRKLTSLSARRQVADNSRVLHSVASGSGNQPNGFARFERMHRQIDQAEAEVEALSELYEKPGWSSESEALAREEAQRVETELAAIKERLANSEKRAE
jgi:phage shock protein A